VLSGRLESENISCKIKASNVPASLSEHFKSANRTANDLIEPVGRIILVNDFALAWIRPDDTHSLNGCIEQLGLHTHYVTRTL
jgi:hypothetical protein